MPAWFDLSTLSSLTDSSSDDEPGLLSSVSSVESLIQSEIDAGIPAEKIVVGGFSQGGAVACLLGLTTSRKLAGVGCLSTWVVLGHKIQEVSGEWGVKNLSGRNERRRSDEAARRQGGEAVRRRGC